MIKPGVKQYVVKEEDGVVVAIGDDICPARDANDAGLDFRGKGVLYSAIAHSTEHLYNDSWIHGGKGVARCADEDAFDENTGRIIASAKADGQLYRAMVKIYGRTIDELEQCLVEAKRLKGCYEEKEKRCNDVIETYKK